MYIVLVRNGRYTTSINYYGPFDVYDDAEKYIENEKSKYDLCGECPFLYEIEELTYPGYD